MVYGQQDQLGQTSMNGAPVISKRKMAVADILDMPEVASLDEVDIRIPSPDSYDIYRANVYAADQSYQLSVRDAAFALQELHNHRDEPTPNALQAMSLPSSQVAKRKRTGSSMLQENVRGLLSSGPEECSTVWSDEMAGESPTKRVRLSAASMYQPHAKGEVYGQHRLITAM
jgi:hypothetical protein